MKQFKSYTSGAVGGKTGKTKVLPGFCKIESAGGAAVYHRTFKLK